MAPATCGDFEQAPDLPKVLLDERLGRFARSGSAFRATDPMIKARSPKLG